MKKVLVYTISITVMGGVTLQNDVVRGKDAGSSMEQRIEEFKEKSPDMQLIKLDEDLIKLRFEQAEKETKKAKRSMESAKIAFTNQKDNNGKKEVYEEKIEEYIAHVEREKSLRYQVKIQGESTEAKRQNKIYEFEEKLWQYTILGEQERLLQQTIAYYEELLEIQKVKKELGRGTALDVLKASQELSTYVQQLKMLSANKSSLEDVIKIESGKELDQNMELDLRIPQKIQPFDLGIHVIIESHLESNIAMKTLAEDSRIKNDSKRLAKEYFFKSSKGIEQVISGAELAMLTEEEAIKNRKNKLTKEYSSFKQSKEIYELAKEIVLLRVQQYKDAREAYNQNQLSSILFKGITLQKQKAEIEEDQASVQYYLSIKRMVLLRDGVDLEEAGK